MPILTQFMEPMKPNTEHKRKINAFHKRLTKFENAKDTLSKEGITLDREEENSAISKIFTDAWNDISYIPAKAGEIDLDLYCVEHKLCTDVVGPSLASYSVYPSVQLCQIKEIAEKMGFVIVPLSYTDPEKMFAPYKSLRCDYYDFLRNWCYDPFCETINFINRFLKLDKGKPIDSYQIYVLAPLPLYDPWLEISSGKETLPKFFPSQLSTVSTTLDLTMPVLRNLFAMSKINDENIRRLGEDTRKNFSEIEDIMAKFSERLDWVERVNQAARESGNNLRGSSRETLLRSLELEKTAALMLDPVIFAVPPKTDISSSSSDNVEVRIGLCFGPEMSVDVFVANGLTVFNSKEFNEIQFPFPLKTLSV